MEVMMDGQLTGRRPENSLKSVFFLHSPCSSLSSETRLQLVPNLSSYLDPPEPSPACFSLTGSSVPRCAFQSVWLFPLFPYSKPDQLTRLVLFIVWFLLLLPNKGLWENEWYDEESVMLPVIWGHKYINLISAAHLRGNDQGSEVY